jgi:hypothetical protein
MRCIRPRDDHAIGFRVQQRFRRGEMREAVLAGIGVRLRRGIGDAGDFECRIAFQDREVLAADQPRADDRDACRHVRPVVPCTCKLVGQSPRSA